METMECTPTLACSSSISLNRYYYHRHARFNVDATPNGAVANGQTNWKLQNNNVNPRCREDLFREIHASLLRANVKQLKEIHARILRTALDQNMFLLAELVTLYAACGGMEDARLLFDMAQKPNIVLWNAMIRGYATSGHCEEAIALFYEMQRLGMRPDKFTFPFVLKACASLLALQEGKEIHDYVVRLGFESDVFVGNSLISMYAKCRRIESARQVFDKMSDRDVISWNAMISGYVHDGDACEALTLINQMQVENAMPDAVTAVSVLQACAHLGVLKQGKLVHGYTIRRGFESNVFVGNSLVDMYGKCGGIENARQVFDKMPARDTVSWNSMIAGFCQNGYASEALTLFDQMQLVNVKTNAATVVSVLQACGHSGALKQGKWIHDYIIRCGFDSDLIVGTSLIDMYAKCGNIEIARHLFDKMSKRDVVSWNAMIAGYAQSGHAIEALTLFHQMQLEGVIPSSATMVSVLPACARLGALQLGKCIHGYIIRNRLEPDVMVLNALIDTYAKCGSLEIARQLFNKMLKRNVVSWSAMIAGYGMHGHGEKALALFSQMQQAGVKPDHITLVSVLSACSHAGLVEEGWQYFDHMIQDYGITPKVEHYACMVDLLGRAGRLHDAQDFIEKMPLEPDVSVWGALLAACRIHGNTELGENVAELLFDLEPKNAGFHVLLSNIYAASGRWDDVAKVRTMMKNKGLKKTPGYSLIEINSMVHAFSVGDRSHPQSEKIYAMLERLAREMEKVGYMPDMNFVLHDVEEEVKEHILTTHSEKLAIAFGLINTSSGTPIRITKNLRVCGDCHSAIKFISKIVMREIIVRDANRFHHFRDGLCSCGDYW